jgi:hypothetical protein
MRGVRIALVGGLTLLAIALALTLSRAPLSVARANHPPGHSEQPVASTSHGGRYCQSGETLPQGTSAIRIWLDATSGPRVRVVVLAGGRAVTSGVRGSNWIGGSVTVPLEPLSRTVFDATVCASFSLHDETIIAQGNAAPAALAARFDRRALSGRIWIEDLRPGGRSWASLAPEVARDMGLGRADAGTWVVFLALALALALVALTTGLLLREVR